MKYQAYDWGFSSLFPSNARDWNTWLLTLLVKFTKDTGNTYTHNRILRSASAKKSRKSSSSMIYWLRLIKRCLTSIGSQKVLLLVIIMITAWWIVHSMPGTLLSTLHIIVYLVFTSLIRNFLIFNFNRKGK